MKDNKSTLCLEDYTNTCPDCKHIGLHGKGSCAMLPDDDLWYLTVYCDKCDVGIEQMYQAIFVKSTTIREQMDD